MAFADFLPAPIARITVAAPVMASPPAYRRGTDVSPFSSATMVPLGLNSSDAKLFLMIGFGDVPRATMTSSHSMSYSLSLTSTARFND